MTKLRELLSRIPNVISFGDLISVAGAVFVFHGTKLVYGLGWACIVTGAILITTASAGDLFAMVAALVHGVRGTGAAKNDKRSAG